MDETIRITFRSLSYIYIYICRSNICIYIYTHHINESESGVGGRSGTAVREKEQRTRNPASSSSMLITCSVVTFLMNPFQFCISIRNMEAGISFHAVSTLGRHAAENA